MGTSTTGTIMGSGSFYADHCSYLPAMAGWFLFSSVLSTYNKVVFGEGHMAFPCPLLITSIHFLVQWIFSLVLSITWPHIFGGDEVRDMSWRTFLSTSVPCGLVTALDVGLSNMALVHITITFYTMIKASSPIFVVLSAFLFRIERVTVGLILVVLVISCGEFLTVAGEVDFNMLGMILCLGASVCSGLRWTLVQLKIQTLDPPLKTAISTMRVLSPSMFVFMAVLCLIIEKPWIKLRPTPDVTYFASAEDAFKTLSIALAGASFAICMILCELYLIMKSTAIVLMIGGVCKELVTIMLGVTIFKDKLNPINVAGFFVVFLGVVLYKVLFHLQKMEREGDETCHAIEDGVGYDDGGERDRGFDEKDGMLAGYSTRTATPDTESDGSGPLVVEGGANVVDAIPVEAAVELCDVDVDGVGVGVGVGDDDFRADEDALKRGGEGVAAAKKGRRRRGGYSHLGGDVDGDEERNEMAPVDDDHEII